ncbi:PREDICTED: uncharacterized protein LOC106816898 [Priapulus caudatus]|uniref:Uncharacterized protein LOC106816898 n=1 Tax=Priapulus caudatus TaxID=37621 RepID=A0ABM1EXV6_PRICU|nr:PREDICTED: uncharacterized protein LOC106816898 [Priapulus caudatus]
MSTIKRCLCSKCRGDKYLSTRQRYRHRVHNGAFTPQFFEEDAAIGGGGDDDRLDDGNIGDDRLDDVNFGDDANDDGDDDGDGVDDGDDDYDGNYNRPLYPAAVVTVLQTIALLAVFYITSGKIAKKSMEQLLRIIKAILPQPNLLPHTFKQLKHMINNIAGNMTDIHACINDCILFTHQYEHLDTCPQCTAARYTHNGQPRKIFTHSHLTKFIKSQFKYFNFDSLMTYRHTHYIPVTRIYDIHQTHMAKFI